MIALLICLVVLVVGFILASDYEYGELGIGLSFVGGGLCLALGIATIIDSLTYADLVSKRAKAVSLQSNIESIRGASYKTSPVSNAILPQRSSGSFAPAPASMVSGSIENMQQSTALSTYIADCAKAKAEYNQGLALAKLNKTVFVYKWVYTGWAIPNQVMQLEELK